MIQPTRRRNFWISFSQGTLLDLRAQASQFLLEIFVSSLDINNIIHYGDALCCQVRQLPSAAPARRSGAETLAPVSFGTPSMMAEFPSTFIFAPILASSSAYLNLIFKNTFRHNACPLCQGKGHRYLGLHICRIARIRKRLYMGAVQPLL